MIRTVSGRLPGEKPPKVSGRISIPASKSHTIRALLIAAFAPGESRLRRPLVSRDSISCRQAVEALGATVTDDGPDWVVQGFGSRPKPPGKPSPDSTARPKGTPLSDSENRPPLPSQPGSGTSSQPPGMPISDSPGRGMPLPAAEPEKPSPNTANQPIPPGMPSPLSAAASASTTESAASALSSAAISPVNIDVGNSGTTLYLAAALAALSDIPVCFDGDDQIRRRSAAPLLDALKAMGAEVESADGGCAPFTVTGPLKTGTVTVDCPVSQYLSALLLAAPLISSPAGGKAFPDGSAGSADNASMAEVPLSRGGASTYEAALFRGSASTDETALARGAASNLESAASYRGGASTYEAALSRGSAPTDVTALARGAASNLESAASARGGALNSAAALSPQASGSGLKPQSEKNLSDSSPEVNKESQTTIKVNTLNEAPYVGITLDWLDSAGIRYERDGWNEFRIPSGQSYNSFDRVVPADWSSATFFLVAAAITGGTLILEGLDYNDSQGDKAVLDMLARMGCETEISEGSVSITGRPMTGMVLDLNATPDALPAMAVAACFAGGETRLINVPQARLKETDRIAVMTGELLKLGADVEELPDGMMIRGRQPASFSCDSPPIKGAIVEGHDDHRVVMALAVAALGGCGELSIKGAEAADVTFPGFFELLDEALGQDN